MKIIKIGALWCPACLITNKALDKFISENNDVELINLDYDFDEEIVKNYNVGTTLPVLIFEENNRELFRLTGEKNYDEIVKAVGELR